MFEQLSLAWLFASFALAAAVVLVSGTRLTHLADTLADRTGLGEAISGAVLLGASTSLGGTVVSITAALDGHASLAFSNSIGGIAAQTAFLAVADLVYRRSNLEHAGAELINIFQAVVLVGLLSLPLVALTLPNVSIWAMHPVSFVIPLVYVGSLFASRAIHDRPMWRPVVTPDTRQDQPEDERSGGRRSTGRLLLSFVGLMVVMGVCGWSIAQTASQITQRLDLSESLVGALATATVTSLPELVTTISAVRRGALQLAIGGIIGGNTFDTLFLPAADVSYRDGSLYHAVAMDDYFWVVIAIVMTVVLLAGLILRERRGFAAIGLESTALLVIYAGAVLVQVLVRAS
ncbi:sodium:calcium antiporter [Consotaella salsifontis]|uniref:Cation:H+ antiporter n=1 Tax=Consotaella salsifontis TaxID=1365950 RepID=A0A1T4RY11_9HYPH|nr:cation transporter [Consotaella salsifontis]SKA20890.1 cation:H+ antiporter [Consotaella salsifontis]